MLILTYANILIRNFVIKSAIFKVSGTYINNLLVKNMHNIFNWFYNYYSVNFRFFLTVHLCYNLINKTDLIHSLLLVYLYLSISTCFGRLWVHHQEKQLCSCVTWYMLFCVDDCLVCRSICSFIPSPDEGPIVARNM